MFRHFEKIYCLEILDLTRLVVCDKILSRRKNEKDWESETLDTGGIF